MIYDIYNERLVLVLVWFMRSGFSRMLISQLNSRCYPYAMLSGSVVQVETHHSPNKQTNYSPKASRATRRWLVSGSARTL